jgi:hypothetical protein
MTSKLLNGDRFIRALQDAGLLPERAASVSIEARYGEPVTMEYAIFADERLLGVANVPEADDERDARWRK